MCTEQEARAQAPATALLLSPGISAGHPCSHPIGLDTTALCVVGGVLGVVAPVSGLEDAEVEVDVASVELTPCRACQEQGAVDATQVHGASEAGLAATAQQSALPLPDGASGGPHKCDGADDDHHQESSMVIAGGVGAISEEGTQVTPPPRQLSQRRHRGRSMHANAAMHTTAASTAAASQNSRTWPARNSRSIANVSIVVGGNPKRSDVRSGRWDARSASGCSVRWAGLMSRSASAQRSVDHWGRGSSRSLVSTFRSRGRFNDSTGE